MYYVYQKIVFLFLSHLLQLQDSMRFVIDFWKILPYREFLGV